MKKLMDIVMGRATGDDKRAKELHDSMHPRGEYDALSKERRQHFRDLAKRGASIAPIKDGHAVEDGRGRVGYYLPKDKPE